MIPQQPIKHLLDKGRIPVRISLKGNKPEDLKRLRAGFNVECEVKY